MKIEQNLIWYHGSNQIFSILMKGSTITQWKELAVAFSFRPTQLEYDDNGKIHHNGKAKGYVYIIDEPISIDKDIIQHPRTSMKKGLEFITLRPLKVKLIQ